jgi:pre-60S factor REI1
MRDKGHCRLNFDREPELLEFWETPPFVAKDSPPVLDQERPIKVSETEIRFTSGKIVGSKNAVREVKKGARKRRLAASTMQCLLPASDQDLVAPLTAAETQLLSIRSMARREKMSIVGISQQQRQAIVLAEKKAQRSEAVARRVREWVYAKGANSQKFDQLDNQRKWGKQNHKLLPR